MEREASHKNGEKNIFSITVTNKKTIDWLTKMAISKSISIDEAALECFEKKVAKIKKDYFSPSASAASSITETSHSFTPIPQPLAIFSYTENFSGSIDNTSVSGT